MQNLLPHFDPRVSTAQRFDQEVPTVNEDYAITQCSVFDLPADSSTLLYTEPTQSRSPSPFLGGEPTPRSSDQLRNQIDHLTVTKEKHHSLHKYYEALECQLNENLRLAVLELYAKRNQALLSLDKLLDNALNKVKFEHRQLVAWLQQLSSQLRSKSQQIDAVLNDLQTHVSRRTAPPTLAETAEALLKQAPLQPQATYESIKLEVASVYFKVTSNAEHLASRAVQTVRSSARSTARSSARKPLRETSRQVRTTRSPELFSISRLYTEDAAIPFLGINKVKVYLAETKAEYYVASITASTTARELLEGVLAAVGSASGYRLELHKPEGTLRLHSADQLSALLQADDYLMLVARRRRRR